MNQHGQLKPSYLRQPATTAPGARPFGGTSINRERNRIDQRAEVQMYASAKAMEVRDFEALLRKRYAENRMMDARDMVNLARDLSGGHELMFNTLMEFGAQWMQGELRIMRSMGT